jgi:tyrosyl-tRNA synthetase
MSETGKTPFKDQKTIPQSILDDASRQCELLCYGAVEVIPEEDLKKMLIDSLLNKKPLRVKCGIDPTNVDVHLGHTIPYRKMRQFQDLGHVGVVVIGDYTARIGDPTGKSESRKSLTEEEVQFNAKKYLEQVYKVVDPKKTEVRFQSEWFGKVGLSEVVQWAMETTVSKLLSHETFADRLKQGGSLGLHELFYPVLQGIDSVYINADVELGGTDQKFNILMGRDYQKHRHQRPQVAMTMPIILGTCGQQKMSKSLNNYIGVLDDPFDQFGKVMSIPDALMSDWSLYVSGWNKNEIQQFQENLKNQKLHPNIAKKMLAEAVVSYFHGLEVGKKMREQFENVFAKKSIPDEISEYKFTTGEKIIEVLVKSGMLASNSEARRLISQNGLSFAEGDKIQDEKISLDESFRNKVLKIGKKKFLKLI